ncbi:MAG: Flp pilus assembly complex ATPase component TadA [Chthoniobacterales bacterium]|nr:Flp pilus assembly complex ATPase component TadA [Chthoniobacterales bacterium]
MNHLKLPPDSPVGQRIEELSKDDRVSDFYLTANEPMVFRFNGQLYYDETVFAIDVPAAPEPGCLDTAIDLHGRRFRVSQMVTRGKLRWVLRLLPEHIPSPADIKIPATAMKAFLEAKNGLFLICGATGSGKSTTIASMVLHRAKRRREHVISFEDPIEFVYPGHIPSLVSQREMGSDEHDFAAALRASLRQAPDVIIIGEIRDGETAEIALQASETGHVVVATLHTSSAAQTVQRFLKLIPSERLESSQASLADCLRLIMCQRLLLDDKQRKRFPVHEVLLQYDGVINIIRRGDFKKLDQELETGWKRGMFNFQKSFEIREHEGYVSSTKIVASGFGWEESTEYLNRQEEISA